MKAEKVVELFDAWACNKISYYKAFPKGKGYEGYDDYLYGKIDALNAALAALDRIIRELDKDKPIVVE